MIEAEQVAALNAYFDILKRVVVTLEEAGGDPLGPSAQRELNVLRDALDTLMCRYVVSPAEVGGDQGMVWILDRLLAVLSSAVERVVPRAETLH